MTDTAGELVALCAVIGLGLLIGRISWKGISLGTSGVVFVALAAGHFGFSVPKFVGVAGVVLFVYCLGLGAGPTFSRTFLKNGASFGLMAIAMIGSGAAAAWAASAFFELGPGLSAGLFAGALTSTPALAAATERLPVDPEVAVGFGIAYPFGVVIVILFVQMVPKLRKWSSQAQAESRPATDQISRILVRVLNPAVTGKRIGELATVAAANCQIPRVLTGNQLEPVPQDYVIQLDQRIMVVGDTNNLAQVTEAIGEKCPETSYILDEGQRRRVAVTSKDLIGKTLRELHLLSRFGVTITRIMRQDVEFVPSPDDKIVWGDALTATGETKGLDEFVTFAGHRERAADESDLIPLAFGLAFGVLVGSVEITIAGETMSAGMAGGPLIVGLAQGQLGRLGLITGRLPRAARLFVSEIGLALFLSAAGSVAGQKIVPVLSEYGMAMCMAALFVVTVPLVTGLALARTFLRLETLDAMGGICGAMTSTPGLGAVTSQSDSSSPATSYATVYPVALILLTLVVPLLISMLM